MEEPKALLEQKIEELIDVIHRNPVDTRLARDYEKRISDAFRDAPFMSKHAAPYQALDHDLSREELLEGLEKLLAENQVDSRMAVKNVQRNVFQKMIMLILAVLLIVVGFAMIIMPAPPSFELFTIFYFNPDDGVTVMDLVSLLIIFGGVLMFVLNVRKK